MAKKTIIITPEKIIPAVTKTVVVGPGYVPVYRWGVDAEWMFNFGACGYHRFDDLLTEPKPGYANDVPKADNSKARYAWLYVPAGRTADEALKALNTLGEQR